MSRRRRREITPEPEVKPEEPVTMPDCPVCHAGTMRPLGGRTGDPEIDCWTRCDRPACGHMGMVGTRTCRACGQPMAPAAIGQICVHCASDKARRERDPETRRAFGPKDAPRRCLECGKTRVPAEDGSCPVCLGRSDRERERISQALQDAGGNQSEAARLLGVPRNTMRDQAERHGADLKVTP